MDNNDDKDKTYYTGVVGKISDTHFEVKLRYNYYDRKRECSLREIFDEPTDVDVPKEWLDRIQSTTYTVRERRGGSTSTFHGRSPEEVNEMLSGFGYVGPGEGFGFAMPGQSANDDEGEASSKKADASVGKSSERRSASFQSQRAGATGIAMNEDSGCISLISNSEDSVSLLGEAHDPNFIDLLTAQYGEGVANGYDQSLAGIQELEGFDDLLEAVFKEALGKMSADYKTQYGVSPVIPNLTDHVEKVRSVQGMAQLTIEYGEEVTSGFDQAVGGLDDIENCDVALKNIMAEALSKMTLQSQLEMGLISMDS